MPERQPMSEAMYYILLALLHPVHGYGVMQRVRELSGGRLVLGPGTLYTILGRFLEEELIREVSVHGRQRNYRLTEEGLRVYQAELARLHRCVADAEKEERHDTSD